MRLGKLRLYTKGVDRHFLAFQLSHHGQSEEEASSQDEQAQAPEALEIKPPQEAHLAEMSIARQMF